MDFSILIKSCRCCGRSLVLAMNWEIEPDIGHAWQIAG